MSRKKNLLEAFRRSDAASASASETHSAPPAAPPAGGQSSLFESRPVSRSGAASRPVWAVAVVAGVLVFALGYVTGLASRTEPSAVEAAPPLAHIPPANQPRTFQERPTPGEARSAAPTPASTGPRLEDSALFDAQNQHTVVVAAYSSGNQDLAWATYEHLREQRLPVFPPVASGNLVVVLVGAAPTGGELDTTLAAVRALVRNGKKEYDDAYLARIDKLIPRSTKGSEKP